MKILLGFWLAWTIIVILLAVAYFTGHDTIIIHITK